MNDPKVAPPGSRTEKCSIGGVLKVGGRMAACAYSMTGKGCAVVKGHCEYQESSKAVEPVVVAMNLARGAE